MGIRGNSAGAKDAHDGHISNELVPFSDIKPRVDISFRPLAIRIGRVCSQQAALDLSKAE